ncbi:MAG: hypothetical protein JXB04_00630 [Kiritimatiellae bacterium]|nr:hypothetical protein [Kiritimatiellia bacterium]
MKIVFGAAALAAAGLLAAAEHVLPTRVVRAMRARFFPGTIRPLDHAEVSRTGMWQG